MATRGFSHRDAHRDNNRNADDADLADCRGFAECDVLCDFPVVITIGTLTTRTLRTAADLPSVMSSVIFPS